MLILQFAIRLWLTAKLLCIFGGAIPFFLWYKLWGICVTQILFLVDRVFFCMLCNIIWQALNFNYTSFQETNRLEYLIPKKTSVRHRLPMGDQGFIDFIAYLLEVNPKKRPSASEALRHPWLSHPYEPISSWLFVVADARPSPEKVLMCIISWCISAVVAREAARLANGKKPLSNSRSCLPDVVIELC